MSVRTPDQYMAGLNLPEVYRVGGSVRDEILGRSAKDSDYMVRGATLAELRSALAPAGKISTIKLRTGQAVGVRASVKGLGLLEVVLPRKEVSTGPGRHDFEMICDPTITLAEDAQRRDFTINALYRDVKSGVVRDPLGRGLSDLHQRRIRTTHPDSFRDDPLRILRALRFVSTLPSFILTASTEVEMRNHAEAVTGLTQKGVSATALNELERLLMGGRPGYALEAMARLDVMAVLLPELAPMLGFEQRSRYHEKTTSQHTFDAVQAAGAMHSHAPLRVRMALLFHDCGKPKMAWTGEDGLQHYYALSPAKAVELDAPVYSLESHEYWGAKLAGEALKRLNAPSRLRQDVVTLIERHMLTLHENIRPIKIRKLRSELGDELLRDLITHRLCDVIGKGGDTSEAVEVLTWVANEQERAIVAAVPLKPTDLKLSGGELLAMGLRGREIGEMQRTLMHEVLAQPKLNTNEWLDRHARKLMT
jgi:tRNA nucleotidyltransferase (CCA-adding enzyme)